MEEDEDLIVWNDFIKNNFEVENKDSIPNDALVHKDGDKYIYRKKEELPKPGILAKKTIRKLATRKIETDATLDLHGLNVEKAKVSFLSFLDTCCKYQYTYVLIVTGKGKGIIKNALLGWFEEDEIFPLIVGYSNAHRLQGGEGAFILHLRKR